jgi:hypothetical protein
MKFAQALIAALVGGFVLNLAVSARAQSTKQYATIVRIQGEARYTAGGNVWHPLTVGQTLGPGNVIQTAINAKVDMVLGGKIADRIVPAPDKVAPATDGNVRSMISYKAQSAQNVIQMNGDTVLAIDKLSAANMGVDTTTDTELDLRQGTIFGSVKKLSAASIYQIKTPNGMAAIRGTTFILSANGTITVTDGSVVISEVINGQTVTQTVVAGQQFDPATGQVTTVTTEQLNIANQTAVATFTLVEGVISFANDMTTIYVSPTVGSGPAPAPTPDPTPEL